MFGNQAIDTFFVGATTPGLWPSALETLARDLGADGATLTNGTAIPSRVSTSTAIGPRGWVLDPLVLGALGLSLALPLAFTPSPVILPPAVAVWRAASVAPGAYPHAVVARYTLPGPWWLATAGPAVLALCRDQLGNGYSLRT